MAREVVENYVACNHLAENRQEATEWLAARTLKERLRFGFSETLNSFPESEKPGLRGMFDLFSSELHTNHLTVTNVRFREPIGHNLYLSGCYLPNITVGIHTTCVLLALNHLERLGAWYEAVPGVQGICSQAIVEKLRDELATTTEQLKTSAEQSQQAIDDAEWADNLSQQEIGIAESIRNQFDAGNSNSSE